MNNFILAFLIFSNPGSSKIGLKISISGAILPSISFMYEFDRKNAVEFSFAGLPVQGTFIFRYEVNYLFKPRTKRNLASCFKAGFGHMGGEGKHLFDFHPEIGGVYTGFKKWDLYFGGGILAIFKMVNVERKGIMFAPIFNFAGMYKL